MNQNDLISVIVPVYNVEKYLPQCLDSIIASTYRNLEIICVNDASTDGSWKILQRYAESDKRVILINCLENGGQALARNRGLDIAKGTYYAFVDSDDYVAPQIFEKLYYQITNDHSDVAVCGFFVVDEETGEKKEEVLDTSRVVLTEKEWWELYQHKHTVIMNCVWNKMYNAECFENKRFHAGIIYEDTELQHKILSRKTISVVSDCLYYYRKRENSTTSANQKYNMRSFSRIDSLINRAEYFFSNKWVLAKACALQDAIKFLYNSIYKSELDKSQAKEIGLIYRKRIQKLMKFQDWLIIQQRIQCIMILHFPSLFHFIRNHIKSD